MCSINSHIIVYINSIHIFCESLRSRRKPCGARVLNRVCFINKKSTYTYVHTSKMKRRWGRVVLISTHFKLQYIVYKMKMTLTFTDLYVDINMNFSIKFLVLNFLTVYCTCTYTHDSVCPCERATVRVCARERSSCWFILRLCWSLRVCMCSCAS